jgi:PIN domain nuclease of toxin-antitoxin system
VTAVLLDTHALLWWVADDPRLSRSARQAIGDADRAIASDVTLWELAIKCSIGKLELSGGAAAWFERHTNASRFGELSITRAHLAEVERLPLHHRDPFDRLLIAQARLENLQLVTIDEVFSKYGVVTVW